MKLYKTGYYDDESNEHKVVWTGTQADAKAEEKQLKGAFMRHILTTPVDVPVDKAGLLGFLNENQ